MKLLRVLQMKEALMTEGGQVDPGQDKHSTMSTKSSNVNFTAPIRPKTPALYKDPWRAPPKAPVLKSFSDPVSQRSHSAARRRVSDIMTKVAPGQNLQPRLKPCSAFAPGQVPDLCRPT